MRKVSLFSLAGLLWLTLTLAPAQAHDNWHYDQDREYRDNYRERLPITSVAEAKHLRDDSRIILSGHIVRRLDDDEFLFSDGTGTIKIEMDDDDWRKLRRHRRGRILIWAEVDRDDGRNELEVERVRPAYR